MEPSSVFATIPHVVKALEYIDKRIKDIGATTPDDAKYYIGYIDIANTAVHGLYDECVGILLQATETPPQDTNKVQALLSRMQEYFYTERLRPKLKDALEHLGVGQGALENHASARLIWPSVRAQRQNALAEYEMLLSRLRAFLDSLGNWEGKSGAALSELESVFNAFKNANPTAQEQAERALLNLSRSQLAQIIGDCARTIEELRLAFR